MVRTRHAAGSYSRETHTAGSLSIAPGYTPALGLAPVPDPVIPGIVQGVVVQDVHNATGDAVINASGVIITGGALTVKNGSNVVIIDGSSDMFRIAAQGTGTVYGPTANSGNSDMQTFSGLGDFTPTFLGFIELGSPIGDALPFVKISTATGHVLDSIRMYTQNLGSGAVRVAVYWDTTTASYGQSAFTYRVYILEQVAF